MTVNSRWMSWKSSAYAVAPLAAVTMASLLAAGAPALAASSGRPGPVREAGLDVPGLRTGHAYGRIAAVQANPSELDGVFCTSVANCWAVGDRTSNGARLNLVLHWTGKHWFNVAVPNPGGTRSGDSSELFAVRCTSASNCWAVGDTQR